MQKITKQKNESNLQSQTFMILPLSLAQESPNILNLPSSLRKNKQKIQSPLTTVLFPFIKTCIFQKKLYRLIPDPCRCIPTDRKNLPIKHNRCRPKIIFGGNLRNPYFCHIFGMECHFFKRHVSAWPRILVWPN